MWFGLRDSWRCFAGGFLPNALGPFMKHKKRAPEETDSSGTQQSRDAAGVLGGHCNVVFQRFHDVAFGDCANNLLHHFPPFEDQKRGD